MKNEAFACLLKRTGNDAKNGIKTDFFWLKGPNSNRRPVADQPAVGVGAALIVKGIPFFPDVSRLKSTTRVELIGNFLN